MDIRFNALNSYQTAKLNPSGRKSSAIKDEKGITSGIKAKADSISISSDASNYGEISRLSNAIRSEIDAANGAERLASIKEAIRNGSYSVSSDEVAGAILDRFI